MPRKKKLANPIYTVGHSTRSIEEFVRLLEANGITKLIDIRTVPRSRTNPQYNADELPKTLAEYGIEWRHLADLGGLRKPRKDTINTAWRNDSFRGYADYMQTEQFQVALDELIAEAQDYVVAVMCAEAVPWRCHRSILADALIARGYDVKHIMSETKTDKAKLHSFAVVQKHTVIYPESA